MSPSFAPNRQPPGQTLLFDADDTLWENNIYFESAISSFVSYLDHRTHLHPGVHRVQDFIVQHPDQKLTIAELSRIAAMSPRNLTRMFHRATGVTPKQFASKVKLQVARDLINDPQRSVESIASSCGFEDSRQLRRLWKQSFGVTIADFRAARMAAAEGREQ